MRISLTAEQESFINARVANGEYESVTDVVIEALRMLEARENENKQEWLKAEIQKGMDDLEAGRINDGPTTMRNIRQRILAMKLAEEEAIR